MMRQYTIAGLSRPRCAWLSDTCIGKHPARLINGLWFPHPHLRRMNLVLSCSLLRGLSPRCASRATAALNVSEKMRLITICAPAANGRFDGPHRSIRLTGARSALGRSCREQQPRLSRCCAASEVGCEPNFIVLDVNCWVRPNKGT
jgi:hypothetical protein